MESVVVSAFRIPQGKMDGVFADVRSENLSVPVVEEPLSKTRLSGEQIEDLRWGWVKQEGKQGNNLARTIALVSDLGDSYYRLKVREQSWMQILEHIWQVN